MCQMGQVTGSVLSPTVLHIYIASAVKTSFLCPFHINDLTCSLSGLTELEWDFGQHGRFYGSMKLHMINRRIMCFAKKEI